MYPQPLSRTLETVEGVHHHRKEVGACCRENEAAGQTEQERSPQVDLDRPNLPAYGTLGQVQARCRAGHRTGGRDRLEGLDPAPRGEPSSHDTTCRRPYAAMKSTRFSVTI